MRFSILILLALTACTAAAPPTPCQRECNHIYESCMDIGAVLTNQRGMRAVETQCKTTTQTCVAACER